MTTRREIDGFLALKRVAMVGVSRDPRDFSRMLFREMKKRGYDMVPVNPGAAEVDGAPCFGRIEEVSPPVEGALLMTNPVVTDAVVHACADAGIRHVWMHRGGGVGAVSASAVEFGEKLGMHVVAGECPFMFLQDSSWFHRLHGFCRKILGSYPTD